MKSLKVAIMVLSLASPVMSHAEGDDCEVNIIPTGASELLSTLEKVSDGLYKNIATMKVNHDGEGALSVFYENGEPKLLKLTYKNGNGTVIKQVSFDDLAKGKPLVYENDEKPGKAIVLEKGSSFKNGIFDFKFKIRSKIKPEQFDTYPIKFESKMDSPKISYNNKTFSSMVISPGVSMFSWDGTFTKVEFKK